jgi:hypothetical protein
MDLAILLAGTLWLVGGRQGLTVGTPGNIFAGVINFGLLGVAGTAGSLDGKHGLALAFPVALPTLLCRGRRIIVRVGPRASTFTGKPPSLFSACAPVGQSIKLGDILDLVHRQLFSHSAVTHVLMERADDSSRMNVWDVVVNAAEPLDVLAQGFAFLLGDDV